MANGVELVHVPEEFRGVITLADRRIAGLMMAWARGGNFDLGFLLRSVYLQGINDGMEAEEQRKVKYDLDVPPLRRRKAGRR
jgi:hypothetical protein